VLERAQGLKQLLADSQVAARQKVSAFSESFFEVEDTDSLVDQVISEKDESLRIAEYENGVLREQLANNSETVEYIQEQFRYQDQQLRDTRRAYAEYKRQAEEYQTYRDGQNAALQAQNEQLLQLLRASQVHLKSTAVDGAAAAGLAAEGDEDDAPADESEEQRAARLKEKRKLQRSTTAPSMGKGSGKRSVSSHLERVDALLAAENSRGVEQIGQDDDEFVPDFEPSFALKAAAGEASEADVAAVQEEAKELMAEGASSFEGGGYEAAADAYDRALDVLDAVQRMLPYNTLPEEGDGAAVTEGGEKVSKERELVRRSTATCMMQSARCYYKMEDHKKCAMMATNVLALDKDNLDALVYRGLARTADGGRGPLKHARLDLEQAQAAGEEHELLEAAMQDLKVKEDALED